MENNSNIKQEENNESFNDFEEIKENASKEDKFDSKGKPTFETPKNAEEKNIESSSKIENNQSKEKNIENDFKNEVSKANSQEFRDENDKRILPEKKENLKIIQEEKNNVKSGQKYYFFITSIIGFVILILSIIIGMIIIFNLRKDKYIILDDEESETFIEGDIDNAGNKNYKAIISIDFGSSYSGFAIAYGENSIESKMENIQPTTIVILKNSLQGYRYGNEAENFMNEQRSDNYIYLDRIKTKLDPKFKNDTQSKIYINSKFPSNYKINLRIIIKEYLRLFSDDALKYYNRKGNTEYSKDNIKWIVTVPAIWNEYGKQFMKNCAKKAGMNKVVIALEPEAASLTMFKDDNVDQKYKEKGKVFMLIDAGGYTLDITINEIVDGEGNLKQLSPPSGGAYGSMNINDHIIKLVEETFTKEKIDDLIDNRFDLWKVTLDSIEKKKKELRDDGSDADYYKIDIRLENICEPGYFRWIFGNNRCSKEISYGKIEYDNKYLYIPRDIMKQILVKNVDKIINHIQKLVQEFPKIDLFVLTGGFAKCVLLKEEIKKHFNYPYKELIDPEISIMKGAALYGIKPTQIVSRKSPYTIGTNKYTKRIGGTECRNMENDECEYFDTFIRKGDDIENNEVVVHSFIPMYESQESVYFPLYFSKLSNQIYIDGNVFKISEFSMKIKEWDIPRTERIFELKMEFGSCITVSGKNLVTGEKIKIFANYYNRND